MNGMKWKRRIAFLMAFVMVMTGVNVGGITAKADTGSGTYTIRIEIPDDWKNDGKDLYIYIWNADGSNSNPTGSWPGTKMEVVDSDENLYGYELEDSNSASWNMIFNIEQKEKEEGYTYTLKTYDINNVQRTVSEKSVYCIINKIVGKDKNESKKTGDKYYNYFLQQEKDPERFEDAEKLKDYNLFVQASWSTVYLYNWDNDQNGKVAWPGTQMQPVEGSNNLYGLKLDDGYTNIIINNGSTQTPDIKNVKTENGKCYLYTVLDSGGVEKTVFTRVNSGMIYFDGEESGGYVYDGKVKTPDITIMDGGKEVPAGQCSILAVSDVSNETLTYSATEAGTYTVKIKGDDTYYIQSASKTWEITKRPVTITAKPQTVNEHNTLQLGVGDVTVEGEGLTDTDWLESIEFDVDKDTGEITPKNAVIRNENTDNNNKNYTIEYKPGTLTVDPHEHTWAYAAHDNVIKAYCTNEEDQCEYYGNEKAVELVLSAADETYNGEAYTAATVTNEITSVTGGEAEITYYKAKSANSVETDGDALSGAPVNAGNYVAQVTIGGATAKKAFTISKREITVKANDQSITYGGSIKTGTDQVTVSSEAPNNLVSGHSLSDISLTVNGEAKVEDPGTIKPSNAKIKQGTTDVTDNYQIEYGDGALTVAKAERTFTAEGYDGVYDGKEHSIRVKDAEGLTITYNESAEGEFTASNPSYKDAGSWTVYYMVQGDDNYEDFWGSEDITITPRDITISDIGAKDKVYDGTTNAELVYGGVKFDGIVDGDKLTVEATGKFEDANVSNGKSVMITDIILGGEDVENYRLADEGQQTSTTADIKAKEIISAAVTGFTVPKKGEEFVKKIACATEGVTGTPVVSYTKTDGTSVTGNAESNTEYVLKVTLSADSIHAFANSMTAMVDGKECDVTKNEDGTVTLSYAFKTAPAIESVTAPQPFTFTEAYGTKEAAASSKELPKTVKVTVQDAENGRTKEIDVPVTWSIEDYNALPEKTNTFTWTIDTTADALKGYDTTGLSEGWNIGTLTVTNKAKSDVEISSVNKEVIYEGTQIDVAKLFTIPEGAGEAAYTLIEDSAEGRGTGTLSDASRLNVSTVGTFKIKVDTAAADYYKAGSAEAVLTVKKGVGSGTVTIAESIRYGQTITPSVTSSTNPTEGVVYEYKEKNAGIDKYSEIVPAAVGEYTVRAKFPAGELYDEAYSDEKEFAIVSTDVVITAKNASITYDGTEYDLGKLFGFGTGCGTPAYTIAEASTGAGTIAGDKLTITKAGEIRIHVQTAVNEGYNAGQGDAVLTVEKAALTVTAKANAIMYGDEPAGNGVTYSGYAEVTGNSENEVAMVNGTVSYTSNYTKYGTVSGSGTSYTITPQGLSSDVYDITYVSGELTVNPKTVTVTWSSEDSFTYDGSEKSVTAEISGTVNGDTISVEYDTDTSGRKQNTAVAAGDYTAVIKQLSGDKAGNYIFAAADAKKGWKITKAGNTFTTEPKIMGWTYGDMPSEPEGTAAYGTVKFLYSAQKEGGYAGSTPENAGTWYMKAVVDGTDNYAGLESNPIAFTIGKRQLTDSMVTMDEEDTLITYDGSAHAPTVTVSDQDGENELIVEEGDYKVSGDTEKTAVGSYQIIVTATEDGNYAGNVTKTWKITKRQNAFTEIPAIADWTYGETAKEPAGEARYGTIKFLYSDQEDGEYDAVVPENAGTWYMKAVVAVSDTYDGLTSDPVQFVIRKAALTVEAQPKSKVYGSADPELAYTVNGLVNGDKAEDILTGTLVREAGEDVTDRGYTITKGTLAAGKNYEMVFTGGIFRITKAEQTAPSGLEPVKASSETAGDGKITGVTENMEYRKGSTGEFTPITGEELTGLEPGTYEVRYVEDSQRNASPVTEVTVGFENPETANVIGVTVTVDKEKLTEKGETAQVTSTVEPEDAADQNVTYSTSDEQIATVDETGKVTAVGNGTVTITVITEDGGKTATVDITVEIPKAEPEPVKVMGVTVTTDKEKLTEKGETAQLTATVEPSDAANRNVSYRTSDEKVATVDETGKVTAVGNGTVTITVTTEDGGKTATVDIAVEIPGGDSQGSTGEDSENPQGGTGEDSENPQGSTGEDSENPQGGTGEDSENPQGGTGEDSENPQGGTGEDSENPQGGTREDSENPQGSTGEDPQPANQVTSGGKAADIEQLKEDNKDTIVKPGSIADEIGVEEVIDRLADETTKTGLIDQALTNVDTGSLAVEVIVTDEEKINGKLDTTDQDTVSAVLEPQELVDVMTGTDIKLELIIEAADEERVREEVLTEIAKQKQEDEEILYFDVDLFKTVTTTTDSGKQEMTTTVTELGEGIQITVEIPQSIREEGRIYRLIRTHKNLTTGQLEVDELPDLDDDPYTYTIMTDKLCTMALTYKDKALGDSSEETDPTKAGDSTKETDPTKAGDSSKETDPTKAGDQAEETDPTKAGDSTGENGSTGTDGSTNGTQQTSSTQKPDSTQATGQTTEQTVITKQQIKENELVLNAGLKVSQTKSKITVKWGKIKGADGYDVYAAYCGKKFNTKKPTKSVKKGSVTSVTIKKLNGKKLKLKKNYKIYVVAYKLVNGKKVRIAKSICAHIVGVKNTKYTNVKRIKLKTSKFTLKVGKTATIKAKTVLVNKNKKQLSDAHAKEFRYASSNTKVATVNRKGKITAKGKGTCTIYVYARNGYAKKVKVTVK